MKQKRTSEVRRELWEEAKSICSICSRPTVYEVLPDNAKVPENLCVVVKTKGTPLKIACYKCNQERNDAIIMATDIETRRTKSNCKAHTLDDLKAVERKLNLRIEENTQTVQIMKRSLGKIRLWIKGDQRSLEKLREQINLAPREYGEADEG